MSLSLGSWFGVREAMPIRKVPLVKIPEGIPKWGTLIVARTKPEAPQELQLPRGFVGGRFTLECTYGHPTTSSPNLHRHDQGYALSYVIDRAEDGRRSRRIAAQNHGFGPKGLESIEQVGHVESHGDLIAF